MLAHLSLLSFATVALALPCISFDQQFNLYAFGVQGQYDWAFGSEKSLTASSGPSVTTIDKTNAPPFDGTNTQCFLAQFFNAIYVLNGDASNPSAVHIFDADSKTWSVQDTQLANGFDVTVGKAILDHDTNVFFALSGESLYQLDMSNQNTAKAGSLHWEDVNNASFNTTGYDPVMAIADNHIFFLDVPGNPAGDANIFVIHFAYFQPSAQTFKPKSGNGVGFPAAGGQTASIWQPSTTIDPQLQFAFFPSDGSSTYIVDVKHNTTTTLPYPPAPPSAGYSAFAGSTDLLVQLTPSGELYYIDINGTSWSKVSNGLWAPPSSSQIASATTTGSSAQSTAKGNSASSGAGSNANSQNSSGVSLVVGIPLMLTAVGAFLGAWTVL